MLRLGISSGALYPAIATEDAPELAARYGLSDVELLLQTAGEYDLAFLRGVAGRARDAGVRVQAIHAFQQLHPLVNAYPRRVEEGRTLVKRAIEGAALLGARAVIWHGLSRVEAEQSDAVERFDEVTTDYAAASAEAGLTLAIENVAWCTMATVRDVMDLAARLPDLAPRGGLGFAFDPFQAADAGANPFMILGAMEGALVDVHLSDFRPGARHLRPGEGDLPWSALIRAIAATGYDGPLMIEAPIPDSAAFAGVQAFLQPLLDAVAAEGDPCAGPPPPGVLEGIELFNRGEYHAAHEAFEHEWHAERRPVRRLYQGILQIGVGLHHARSGNHRGAVLLLTDGLEKTGAFLPTCQGIHIARLVRESQACLDQIVALGPGRLGEFDWAMVPLVRRLG